jgi:hypothetical protein
MRPKWRPSTTRGFIDRRSDLEIDVNMRRTDGELDHTSQDLLRKLDELKRTEERKRQTARSSGDFHRLAEQAEDISREVFESAHAERLEGEEDSPIATEREQQEPGDWTDEAAS